VLIAIGLCVYIILWITYIISSQSDVATAQDRIKFPTRVYGLYRVHARIVGPCLPIHILREPNFADCVPVAVVVVVVIKRFYSENDRFTTRPSLLQYKIYKYVDL
jgi:hypothetical protein